MKLAYFRDPKGNFGDDLNPWLWEKLLPSLIDDVDDGRILVGVGTILEPWFAADLPAAAKKIVVGSGAGMSVPTLAIDESWDIVCVRGPLTAAYLGLEASLAATDPAMCIRDLWSHSGTGSGRAGFMPHHRSLERFDWQRVCADAGIDFIDPHAAPLDTLDQMAGLRLVLTEAMHGAIVADALRVPWFPLQISPINYVGKWHDWAASLRMPIHFKPLPDLYDPLRHRTPRELLAGGLRPALYEWRQGSSRRERDRAVHLLRVYAEKYESYLSEDADLDRAIDLFRSRIARLADGQKGN